MSRIENQLCRFAPTQGINGREEEADLLAD
jgi:hypothetical protein